jgi:hypothetical protein
MSERTITERLADFFDAEEIKWKPGTVKGDRALAMPYIDARCVMDRLDEVLGVDGWQDEYDFLPDGSCTCRLRLRLSGEWIQKMDVGGESEQKDEGDRRKAALSDALKRTAVKFGVGRYLYSLGSQWCDYDQHKKKFVKTPTLPDWAQKGKQAPAPRQAEKPAEPESDTGDQREPRKVTADEMRELHGLVEKSGRKWAQCVAWLKGQKFRITATTSMAELTEPMYRALKGQCEKIIGEARSPEEVIGNEEVVALESALQREGKDWQEAKDWLRDKGEKGGKCPEFPEEGQSCDLNWKQYRKLMDVLSPRSRAAVK